jgi:ABC-type Na+ transport system ATPase subunit NatA
MTNPEFEDLNLVFNKLDIYGLFGMYDYENITFRTKEGVLILYGLNGMGKTTIEVNLHPSTVIPTLSEDIYLSLKAVNKSIRPITVIS